jgi:uncharacterized protein
MNLRLSRVVLLCLALAGWSPAFAQDLPDPTESGVLDLAEVLDATEEARIDRLLGETLDSTGVTIEVVTMTDIATHGGAGERLDAYATRLFNDWGIGSAESNDGILILVATGEREARIALGVGYDAVYNERAARVLTTAVLPEFRAGRIAAGIEAGIVSARLRLIAPFLEGRPVSASEGFEAPKSSEPSAVPYVAGIGGILGLIGFMVLRNSRIQRTCPNCGEETLTRTKEEIEPATAFSSGTGLEHLLCNSCGFTDRKTYTFRRSQSGAGGRRSFLGGGSSSGSGRSSRSGGRSSGGGASGKW